MPKLNQVRCVLAVVDHRASADFYRAKLGFKLDDALHAEYTARGVTIIQDLADKPWGLREFGIETPDGHRIMFGQEIAPP